MAKGKKLKTNKIDTQATKPALEYINGVFTAIPAEESLNQIKLRMAAIIERQKNIVVLMDTHGSETHISEFKELGEEYSKLSAEFMKRYFKK